MSLVYFRCVPFDKDAVTLALEAGVDGVIVPDEHTALVAGLSRCDVWPDSGFESHPVAEKADEAAALAKIRSGRKVAIAAGWEVIPIENLLAQSENVFVEAENLERARLASGILEKGVAGIVANREALDDLRQIVSQCKFASGRVELLPAEITRVERVGLGHRVCLDTLSLLHRGQGMLVGNSSAFTFLVHAETEHNEYVASRPFRINAGAVHAYCRLTGDKTTYLGELKAGAGLLVVDYKGETAIATLGRVKIEVRPMLLIEALVRHPDGTSTQGSIFLQNAETIRLTSPEGEPLSVVSLKPGDRVLCHLDVAGRHFGMRVSEEIREE